MEPGQGLGGIIHRLILIKIAQGQHALGVALTGGALQPGFGQWQILGDAQAFLIKLCQIDHGIAIARLGAHTILLQTLAKPDLCSGLVLAQTTAPILVKVPHGPQRSGIVQRSRLAIPVQRLHLIHLLSAPATLRHQPQVIQRLRIAECRPLAQPVQTGHLILGNAVAQEIGTAQLRHGRPGTQCRRFMIPDHGLCFVFLHPIPGVKILPTSQQQQRLPTLLAGSTRLLVQLAFLRIEQGITMVGGQQIQDIQRVRISLARLLLQQRQFDGRLSVESGIPLALQIFPLTGISGGSQQGSEQGRDNFFHGDIPGPKQVTLARSLGKRSRKVQIYFGWPP